MYVIGKKVKGLVDVKEHTNYAWIGYPTYIINYEDYWNTGHYNDAEFVPSKQTQQEIDRAIAEFPEPIINKKEARQLLYLVPESVSEIPEEENG